MTKRERGWIVLWSVAQVLAVAGCRSSNGRPGETIACTPGASLTVGCGCADLGSCTGDPVLVVCPGAIDPGACAAEPSGSSRADDSCGRCPSLGVTCPAAGAITVAHHDYGGDGDRYRCDWDVHVNTGGGGAPLSIAEADAGAP